MKLISSQVSEEDKVFRRALIDNVPHLRRYARALMRAATPTEADDLVQDCLVRALEHAHSYQPRLSMRPWLFTILHNLYVSDVRQRAGRTIRPLPTVVVSVAPVPPRTAEANEEMKALSAALGRLPEAQRLALLLVGLEGLTYAEAACTLGVPIGTVRSRISRGRETLRRTLGHREHEQSERDQYHTGR